MAFVETANLKTKDKKGSFLGDVLATVGPMALGALGSIASGGMSQIGGGLVSSILGGGNESTKAMGGNIPQMTKYASGGTHEQNGLGGIPVDELGNPSMNASALTEQGEVGYKLPNDQTGYVFSNRIKVPGKKHTFADEAKRVASRYKNRLGENLDKPDSLAKRALDMAMNTLKDSQEAVKQQEQEAMAIKAMGGYLDALATGGPIKTKSGKKLQNFDYKEFDPNFPVFELGANETLPTLPKKEGGVRHGGNTSTYEAIAQSINNPDIRDAAIISSVGNHLTQFMDEGALNSLDQIQRFKAYGGGLPKYTPGGGLPNQDRENYLKYHSGLPEAYIGYGLQAATRIPQLFTKPESIHYDRINPETIDLAQERGSMETSRNNQLGFLKRQAGMAGSAGQALNYLSSVVPQAYNQYDQQYAQSVEREQNANAQILNQANAQNAQIQMREAEANAMERDAARGIRDQALADIGKTGLGALTAKKSALEQYNALKMQGMINDFDFAFDKNGVRIIRDGRKESTTPATTATTSGNSTMEDINNAIESFSNYISPELGSFTPIPDPDYKFKPKPALWEKPYTPEEEAERDALLRQGKNPDLYDQYKCGGSLKKCKGGYLKKKGKK